MKKVFVVSLIVILIVLTALFLTFCNATFVENETSGSHTEEMKLDTIRAAGIFNGAIDGNSIEIEIEGVPRAFRTEELLREGESLDVKDGSDVVIVFYINEDGQRMILELDEK